jgi:hypothetical protein
MKKVSNLTVRLLILIAVVTSCKKSNDVEPSKSAKQDLARILAMASGFELTEESSRIYAELADADYLFGAIHFSNEGNAVGTEIMGMTGSSTQVSFNGQGFTSPNFPNESWWRTAGDGEVLFGQVNTIYYDNGNGIDTLVFAVPEKIYLNSVDSSGTISSSSAVLTWNADSNNPTGQVLIHLTYLDEFNGMQKTGSDLIITDDDGYMDISSNLSNTNPNFVKITIGRGNGRTALDELGRIFVQVRTQDEHMYKVTN